MRNVDVIGSKEAAELLQLSQSQVNRRAAAGEIPYIRKNDGLRGPYIFDRSAIERISRTRVSSA
jgi:predicted site-specific integrase-resolvase